jgi:hypothetical protein
MIDCHGITEQQWAEFSEDGGQNEEIAAHVRECGTCSQVYRESREWSARLAEEGQVLRAALELPEAARERMLSESLARVSAARASGAAEGIARLRLLLGPVFGAGTVRATVEAALSVAAPAGICGANWKAFAAQLSEAIQSICGQAAGHLAERAALSLAIPD